MFRDALFLGVADLRFMLRQRETILWTFLMPILFFFFIGTVTGNFRGGSAGKIAVLVSKPADAGFVADRLIARLADQGIVPVLADTVANSAAYARRLSIPAALTDSVLAGRPAKLRFERTGGGMGADYDRLRVQRATFAVLGDLVVAAREGREPDAAALAAVDALPRTLTLEVAEAGRRREIPTGFEQAIPGTMVMFTVLVLLTSGAVLLVAEREQGLLRRLASAPVSRGAVVLGKAGARWVLGIIQIGFAMLTGTVLFRVGWGPDLPMVVLMLLTYGAVCAALAFLLGNLARSSGQAVAIGVITGNVFGALGGCWWPIEVVPRWMQKLALFLPTGWAMDGLHKLVSFQSGAPAAMPHVIGMALAALCLGWLGARTFRFR